MNTASTFFLIENAKGFIEYGIDIIGNLKTNNPIESASILVANQ